MKRQKEKKQNCKELRKELITRHADRAVCPIGQILNDGELFNLIWTKLDTTYGKKEILPFQQLIIFW